MPGKHVTCFCFSLGIEIKGSVPEFSKEAILGIITGNFLVGKKAKQKQNQTHRKLLLKESREGVHLERRCLESPVFRKTERTTVLLRKPTEQKQIS